jgi:hypothetical protein
MRASRALLVALGTALSVAACGTTVPLASRVDVVSSPQPGTDAAGPSDGTAVATVPGGSGPGSTLRPGTTQVTAPGASQAPVPGADTPVSGALEPVEVGIIVETNTQQFAGSLGFGDIDNGNERAVAQATVDDANAHGGLHGHKIAPVFFTFDPTYSGSYASLEQSACSLFTEDHHVVAILVAYHIDFGLNLVACAARKGVAVIAPVGYGTFSEADLQRFPLFVTPGAPTMETGVRAQVDALAGTGFLGRSSTIGLVRYSGSQFDSGEKVMRSALSRHGLRLAMAAEVGSINQTSDIGPIASAVASAELRFRAAGVDRVLFISNGAFLALEFTQAADKQGYRPRYGLASTDAPATLVTLAPARQLEGSQGIGWGPFFDITDVRKAPPPGLAYCLARLKAHGQQPAAGTAQSVGAEFCEQMDVLTFGPRLAGVNGRVVTTAIEAIGRRYASPQAFASFFGPGHRAGASVYRRTTFDTAAGSMVYTSGQTAFTGQVP